MKGDEKIMVLPLEWLNYATITLQDVFIKKFGLMTPTVKEKVLKSFLRPSLQAVFFIGDD